MCWVLQWHRCTSLWTAGLHNAPSNEIISVLLPTVQFYSATKQVAKNIFSRRSSWTETGSCFPSKYLSSKSNKPGANVSLKSSMALQNWNITSVDLIEELLMLILKVWAFMKAIHCSYSGGDYLNTEENLAKLLFNPTKMILLKPFSADAWRQ